MSKLNPPSNRNQDGNDLRGLTKTIKNIDLNDKSRDLNAKRMIDVNGRSIEYNEKHQF